MKKLNYSAAALSACALMAISPEAYADTSSQAEIAALKAQLQEMALQQQKAAAVIDKLASQVDKLQKQNSLQASKVSDIEKQQLSQAYKVGAIENQQYSQAPQAESFAKAEPASGGKHDGGAYVGVFGGAGSGSGTVSQLGSVFIVESSGGPQGINAKGNAKSDTTGIVGAQAGYEWSYGPYLRPAVEVEALYLPRTKQDAQLVNQDSSRITENLFNDSLPTDTSVVLANAVMGFRTPYRSVTPYVGGGIGAAYVSVSGATSEQLDAAEPGINHFNSERSSSVLTAAAQLKAGARVDLTDSTYLFGEYRYLFIGANDQTFGPTIDATHAPTSQWTVSYDGTSYNLATVGLGVRF